MFISTQLDSPPESSFQIVKKKDRTQREGTTEFWKPTYRILRAQCPTGEGCIEKECQKIAQGLFYFIFFQISVKYKSENVQDKPCEVKKEQILWKTSESCTVIGLQRAGDHTSSHQPKWMILLNICGTIIENKWVVTLRSGVKLIQEKCFFELCQKKFEK